MVRYSKVSRFEEDYSFTNLLTHLEESHKLCSSLLVGRSLCLNAAEPNAGNVPLDHLLKEHKSASMLENLSCVVGMWYHSGIVTRYNCVLRYKTKIRHQLSIF